MEIVRLLLAVATKEGHQVLGHVNMCSGTLMTLRTSHIPMCTTHAFTHTTSLVPIFTSFLCLDMREHVADGSIILTEGILDRFKIIF